MAYTLKSFGCTVTKMPSANSLPFAPHVTINLKTWTVKGKDGTLTISPDLMTAREIDEHIDGLKADLEMVRAVAKRELELAKETTLALLAKRTQD